MRRDRAFVRDVGTRSISPHRKGRAVTLRGVYRCVLCVAALAALCLEGCSWVGSAEASTRKAGKGLAMSGVVAAEMAAARPVALSTGAEDRDGDGIDDVTELSLAKSYFPYYST